MKRSYIEIGNIWASCGLNWKKKEKYERAWEGHAGVWRQAGVSESISKAVWHEACSPADIRMDRNGEDEILFLAETFVRDAGLLNFT